MYRAICKILWEQWDPIGVNDNPVTFDEYNAYTGGVYTLLARGASEGEITNHLRNIETNHTGLRGSGDEHLASVAAMLRTVDLAPPVTLSVDRKQAELGNYSSFITPTGVNLQSEPCAAAEALSAALSATIHFLETREPPGILLRRYADWWEHDGLHFDAGDINFKELARIVDTGYAVKAAKHSDFNVFVGVASPTFQWYLRFYFCGPDDFPPPEPVGRFDITLPSDLILPYRQTVSAPLSLEMTEQEPLTYYKSLGMDSQR